MNYDIFLSYRREGGFETATLIAEKLRNAGYNVFLDVESLRAGKFNEQLYSIIEDCKDFILVLPKDGLDRCIQETDWVRREVVHAMQHNKNIIPVLLSGFEWPEMMPEGLDGLNEYQAVIANNHQFFDASVERLKSYLLSKPYKIRNRKVMKGFFLLLFLLILFLSSYYCIRVLAVPVCREQVDKITLKMGKLDMLTSINVAVGKEWNNYYLKYEQALPRDTAYLNTQIRTYLQFQRNEIKKLQQDTSAFSLNTRQDFFLSVAGVNIAELEAFHTSLYPSFFDDAYHFIEMLETFLSFDFIPELSVSSSDLNVSYAQHSANLVYYGYLEMLSEMPEKALKSYEDLSHRWRYFPTYVGVGKKKEEYERLQNIEIEKMNALVRETAFLTTEQTYELQRKENEFRQLQTTIEENGSAGREIEQRVSNIMKLSAEVLEMQQQLQETERAIEESLRRTMDKCKLDPEDDQYLMWGKIVRLSTLMAGTNIRRLQSERINQRDKEEAKLKGYNVSEWYEVKYSLSMDEVLQGILYRLDQYMEFFPETRNYAIAVKQFYKDVKNNHYEIGGMVVMGTKENQPHPVFKPGDIVLTRKGRATHTTAEYKEAKELPGDDLVSFLRLSETGKLKRITNIIPDTDVLIGFLELKEDLN